jgi:toxin ParE1/3/4
VSPKRFDVVLTEDAAIDLEELYAYVASHDSTAKAEYVLARVTNALDSLATFPERSSYPKELLGLGIREVRETFFKPYRIIYRVEGKRVLVLVIADGRREMRSLLARRLLSG